MAYGLNQSETDVAAMVRSALVDRISSERYDLWISSDASWSFDGQTLAIQMRTDFACQLARKMLGKDISLVAREILGDHIDVDFSVAQTADQPTTAKLVPVSTGSLPCADDDQPIDGPADSSGYVDAMRKGSSLSDQLTESPSSETKSALPSSALPSIVAFPQSTPPAAQNSPARKLPGARSNGEFGGPPTIDPIRGISNELACTTAMLAINDPGRLSPAFFHGPSGCGKSVIASSISRKLRVEQRMRRVVHMTSEQFTNDFMEGLRGGGLPMFRRKYRDVQALVLDDIQFFVGKKSTLAEVKHTLDNLIKDGRQVVCTADRSLNDLGALGNDIIGRLRGGLVAPIGPLDETLRGNLLRSELEREGVALDDQVIEQLAGRCCGDGRVVCGVAKRLTAAASVGARPLSWEKAWEAVFDLVQATQPVVRIVDIDRVVCSVFGLEPQSLKSPSKMRSVSQPRMLAMFLARKYTPAAYKEIGEYFGKRRHSTVISAEKTVETWLTETGEVSVARGMSIKDAIRHVESQLQVG